MTKLGDKIMAGLQDALAYSKGDKSRGVLTRYVVDVPILDVKAIRKKLGLTQESFCNLFSFKPHTLQAWEDKKKKPNTAAYIFLTLIDQHSATVKRTLEALAGTAVIAEKKQLKPGPIVKKATKKLIVPKAIKDRSGQSIRLSKKR